MFISYLPTVLYSKAGRSVHDNTKSLAHRRYGITGLVYYTSLNTVMTKFNSTVNGMKWNSPRQRMMHVMVKFTWEQDDD